MVARATLVLCSPAVTPETDDSATTRIADWAAEKTAAADFTPVAKQLGAIPKGPDTVGFGVWVPSIREGTAQRIELELFVPPDDLDVTTPSTTTMRRHRLEMTVAGETAWLVVSGVPIGTKDRVGAFYRFHGIGAGEALILPDPMGMSFPFGAFAPAEVVDLTGERMDSDYFSRLGGEGDPPRLGPPANILQVHVRSATEEGTLAALGRRIEAASRRVAAGEGVEPGDRLWMEYESIELLPVEPLITYEDGDGFWIESESETAEVEVRHRPPDMLDWGYDVPICGSGTVTPTLLESGRPHELTEFVSTLHNLPTGPIKVIFDVVYGHADNQAKGLMPDAWFTGPDMYGQHLDYLNPFVRSQLLEIQRRKGDFGADALRVDGAQDFTWWDFDREELIRDDGLMLEMCDVTQEVAGVRYRPFMIFEDGRPWPRDDWELASSYRAVIDVAPHVFQWGPLTFAHNTPFLFTFWVSKWWRLREIAEFGSNWISGCANHDTLRRGSQVDPRLRINTFLGDTLPDVIERAYDHPAATLLFHAFLPGAPMDFLQGIARTPWSFIRNTDRRYALKVWGEEARFLDWRVTGSDYEDPHNFRRLKSMGFTDRGMLYEFMSALEGAVLAHGDAVEPVIAMLADEPRPESIDLELDSLVEAARAWMEDVHDFCTVDQRRLDRLDPVMVSFDEHVRRFRRRHPWLVSDLGPGDTFAYRHPTRGSVVFYGHRIDPAGGGEVLFVANMEGEPAEVTPVSIVGVDADRWEPALRAPGVAETGADRPVTLPDATGLVYFRPARR